MALEGNLTAFGLSEILQLIAVQQKTGMLTVTNQNTTTVMFFRNGEVVSTRDRRRKARDSFKDYLTRYGVLEQDALVRVSQISASSKLDFVDILTSEGFLEPEELHKHWRAQIQEAMHDILTWEEGSYKFVTSTELVDGIKSPSSFNVEGMLMESMRRIDEFPQMLEMFPSEKLVFSRTESEAPADDMTSNEAFVLSLLDGPATLHALIGRGRMPVFEVYEALKNLQEKELVAFEEPPSEEVEPTVKAARARTKRRQMKNALPVVLSLALFLGAMYVGFRDAVADLSPQRIASETMDAGMLNAEILGDSDVARTRVEYQLRWLIEAYRADVGHYPANLGELSKSNLATPAFMEEARRHEFRYRLTGGGSGYNLL